MKNNLTVFMALCALIALASRAAQAQDEAKAKADREARRAARSAALAASSTPPSEPGGWETFTDGSIGSNEPFQGHDGTSIPGYLRKPKGDGPFPVVVLLHGGTASPQGTYDHGHLTYPTSNFIAEGWAVYAIDFRPDSNLLPIEWQDTLAAIEHAKKFPHVDGMRVAVMGCSHGAHTMARVAARTKVNCAILAAPAVLNLWEIIDDPVKQQEENNHVRKMIPLFVSLMEREFKAPIKEILADPRRFDYESPLAEMDKISMPVFVICGQNDANYHVVRPYADKLQQMGKIVETYFPENGPHGFQIEHPMIPETKEAALRVVAFIRKCFDLDPN